MAYDYIAVRGTEYSINSRKKLYGDIVSLWIVMGVGGFAAVRTLYLCVTMGGLCPLISMEELSMAKQDNAQLYGLLMASRNRDRKHYALSCIAVAYEDVRNYANCKGCNREELRHRANAFSMRMREVVARYGLSGDEVRAYFQRNNYVLSF